MRRALPHPGLPSHLGEAPVDLLGLRQRLRFAKAPVVAVSPLIAGKAAKGPTAKMLAELGVPATSASIARHYGGLLDALVLDEADATEAESVGVPCLVTKTLMTNDNDKQALARQVLDFAASLRGRKP